MKNSNSQASVHTCKQVVGFVNTKQLLVRLLLAGVVHVLSSSAERADTATNVHSLCGKATVLF